MLFEKVLIVFDNYHSQVLWLFSFLKENLPLPLFTEMFFEKKLTLSQEPTGLVDYLNLKLLSDSFILIFTGLFGTNIVAAFYTVTKFLLCISLLIFARGGIPRFRFDYLTKLGWIRFLSLVLLSFLIEILIINVF